MSPCPTNCTFTYHSVVPPTHCPHCGRCLGCGSPPPPARPVPIPVWPQPSYVPPNPPYPTITYAA